MGAYLLLPNLAFAIVGQFVYVTRPIINVDYLLLGSVAGLLPKRVSMLAYAVLLANDAFVSLSPVFHFGLETALFSIHLAFTQRLLLSIPTILLAAGVLTIAALSETLSGSRPQRVGRPSLLAVAALILAIDIVGGTSGWSKADTALQFNLATSALYRTTAAIRRDVMGAGASIEAARPFLGPTATDGVRRGVTHGPRGTSLRARHIVLVMVESLGHFPDASVDSAVLAPLLSHAIRTRYDVRMSTVSAHGATTSGELRELCKIDGDYRIAPQLDGAACLPMLLRQLGFRTIAVHGYSRKFFDRYQWYPRVGFERMFFAEELTALPGAALCGTTFRGVCDADAIRVVKREIVNTPPGERRFVYWLTLSSHLPIDLAGGEGSTLDCGVSAAGRRFAEVCALMRMHRLVAQELAAIATDPALPSTRFILVGDHPPPFWARETRSQFAPDEVPFIELVPKQPTYR